MMREIKIKSNTRTHFIDITPLLQSFLKEEEVIEGTLHLFVPHTTAGITINEGADPSVMEDMDGVLDGLIPWRGPYRHREGNTAAHVKSSLMGTSLQVMVEGGRLVLGTWQAIFFCEFDGPRQRKILLRIS